MKWSGRRSGSPSTGTSSVLFDLIEQPLFVYRPVPDDDGAIVDLEFVEMNRAARDDLGIAATPVGDSVRGWLTDLDLLWDAANAAWQAGRAAPYDLDVQRGNKPDATRSFTIETARDGDHIVQVAAPRTDARLLRDERDRFASTLDALDDGVIVLRPIVDGSEVLDARIEFVNAACSRLFRRSTLPAGFEGPQQLVGLSIGEIVANSDVAEAIVAAVAAAAQGTPVSLVLDNSTGSYPLLVPESTRLAFVKQSASLVIMVVEDVSMSTFAEHRWAFLVEFGQAILNGLDQPAFIVRGDGSDLVIDEASPSGRELVDRPLPCTIADLGQQRSGSAEAIEVFRRVIDRMVDERGVSLACFAGPDESRWTVVPLPGGRAFAIADRSTIVP